LEVLDPEQNAAFNDHYLEVDYDLSKVLFIATANVKYDSPAPLLDRMEIIELSSYLDFEKAQIARQHLIPRQLEKHGIKDFSVNFTDDAIKELIQRYTKEAGVRNLERQIASVIRKTAKKIVYDISLAERDVVLEMRKQRTDIVNAAKVAVGEKTDAPAPKKRGRSKAADAKPETVAMPTMPLERYAVTMQAREKVKPIKHVITSETVHEYLKTPVNRKREKELSDKVGVVTGLAWTSLGGDILPVEVTIMPGKDKLTLTGKLGDVMKESAMAALSFVRANAEKLGVSNDALSDREIHIHVPEGAIPKDGPSAGITMTMALVSAASNRPARGDIAMTGEVTLRGNILAIGGLNEKLLAAKHAGITTVLIPKENEVDLLEMNEQTTEGLRIVPVAHIGEALKEVFRN
jgi:ATP-dependent Lon protease